MFTKTNEELQAVADKFWMDDLRPGFVWELSEALKKERIFQIYKLAHDEEVFDTNGGSPINYFLNTCHDELKIGQDEAMCLYNLIYDETATPEQKAEDNNGKDFKTPSYRSSNGHIFWQTRQFGEIVMEIATRKILFTIGCHETEIGPDDTFKSLDGQTIKLVTQLNGTVIGISI